MPKKFDGDYLGGHQIVMNHEGDGEWKGLLVEREEKHWQDEELIIRVGYNGPLYEEPWSAFVMIGHYESSKWAATPQKAVNDAAAVIKGMGLEYAKNVAALMVAI